MGKTEKTKKEEGQGGGGGGESESLRAWRHALDGGFFWGKREGRTVEREK
jgi:hypothetical protein